MKFGQKTNPVVYGALIAALVAAAIFLPDIVGFGWHLIHGKTAGYRGLEVPVPQGWFAARHGESLTIERMLRIPLFREIPTVVFLPMHMGKNAVFNRDMWSNVQIEIQNRRGYLLSGTRQVSSLGSQAYCWEFSKTGAPSRWWITCLIPKEDLSADFSGPRSFAPTFYSILPKIQHASGAN